MTPLHFIIVKQRDSHVATRELELEMAEARAHVARVSHKRKRRRFCNTSAKYLVTRQSQATRAICSKPPNVRQCHESRILDDRLRQPQLLSALGGGNSDPFQSTAIPLNPVLIAVISFHRDGLVSKIRPDTFYAPQVAVLTTQFAADLSNSLKDPLSQLALMTRYASIVAFITRMKDLYTLSLALQGILLRELTTLLQLEPHLIISSTAPTVKLWTMYSLLASANYLQDFYSASLHAQALFSALEEASAAGLGLDLRLLSAALWQDVQRAQLTLTPPSFEVDKWQHHVTPNGWNQYPHYDGEFEVDGELDTSDLKKSHIDLHRVYCKITETETQPVEISDKVFGPASCWLLMIGAKLQKLQCRLREGAEIKPDLIKIMLETRAVLATIYCHRRIAKLEDLGKLRRTGYFSRTPYVAAPHILQQLRILFESPASIEADTRKPRLTLWALYVAAEAEGILVSTMPEMLYKRDYFGRRFFLHAKAMGLHSWAAVERVLKGFLFTSVIFKHAPQSFHDQGSEYGLVTMPSDICSRSYPNRGHVPTRASIVTKRAMAWWIARSTFYEPSIGTASWFLQPAWSDWVGERPCEKLQAS